MFSYRWGKHDVSCNAASLKKQYQAFPSCLLGLPSNSCHILQITWKDLFSPSLIVDVQTNIMLWGLNLLFVFVFQGVLAKRWLCGLRPSVLAWSSMTPTFLMAWSARSACSAWPPCRTCSSTLTVYPCTAASTSTTTTSSMISPSNRCADAPWNTLFVSRFLTVDKIVFC